MNNLSEVLRWVFTAIGAVLAILEPTLPYLIICTVMILADCYTAWSLSKRAQKSHPDKVSQDGKKFNSHNFGKVIVTLLKAYALIVMAFMIQRHITDAWPIDLTKVAAGAICFWQLWSILENESSCNGSKWAKLLQKILVDKTSRHFDIDLSDIKPKD
ncbi:MAG: phage holin family protein [Muribaculaceae bacterium]|nr:phage holin family protein [Muribaculaceae bacterium]